MNREIKTRIQAVKAYLDGDGLKKTALRFHIHPTTLYRWKRWYEQKGREFYKKPWNRFPKEIEEKAMFLKESNPPLTIRKAKDILEKEGIIISIKGIHSIWKRYNLLKRSTDDPFSPFGPLTVESKCAIERVEDLFADKLSTDVFREAAQILNALPTFPANKKDILKTIPEKFLSPRRNLDSLYARFAEIPLPEFLEKIKKTRKSLEDNRYFYSATVAGLLEILALDWMETPEEELELISTLKNRTVGMRDSVLHFELALFSGKAHAKLLHVENAFESVKKCRRLLCALPYSSFLEFYGFLMTTITDYRKAFNFHKMALVENLDELTHKRLLFKIGHGFINMGKYREAKKIFTNKLRIRPQDKYWSNLALYQSFVYFASGELDRASNFLKEAIEKSEKEQCRNTIYAASICLAAIAQALGTVNESKNILKKILPLLEKYRLEWEITTIKFLLEGRLPEKNLQKFPYIHLLYLLDKSRKTLKAKDYQTVLYFAKRKGLVDFLHRLIVFFPEIIIDRLQKGRADGLPRSILKFPVFNKEIPVYLLKFLGNIIIYKNQEYMKVKLTPKEEGFLVYLAQKVGEPEKFIFLDNLYNNFWSSSKKPSKRLSRLLASVRKKLRIPKHLIVISGRDVMKRLTNRGVYITTDYNDFEITLTQARALERSDEWGFAREKYLQAFKLIRGAPFRKIFDNWSDNMRHIIFSQLENATMNFAKSCLAHRSRRDAIKVLQKVSKIIPYSDGIKHYLNNLTVN